MPMSHISHTLCYLFFPYLIIIFPIPYMTSFFHTLSHIFHTLHDIFYPYSVSHLFSIPYITFPIPSITSFYHIAYHILVVWHFYFETRRGLIQADYCFRESCLGSMLLIRFLAVKIRSCLDVDSKTQRCV